MTTSRGVTDQAAEAIRAAAPLGVSGVAWAGETLTVWGSNWSFSTMSNWRLLREGRFTCSSIQGPHDALGHLNGCTVNGASLRPGALDDITLEFSGDIVLEVFSDIGVEPWVMRLPSCVFVPSDIAD
ncbi:MAG: hypothetical protein ABMA64_42165 [Myxococcota bacterium]